MVIPFEEDLLKVKLPFGVIFKLRNKANDYFQVKFYRSNFLYKSTVSVQNHDTSYVHQLPTFHLNK